MQIRAINWFCSRLSFKIVLNIFIKSLIRKLKLMTRKVDYEKHVVEFLSSEVCWFAVFVEWTFWKFSNLHFISFELSLLSSFDDFFLYAVNVVNFLFWIVVDEFYRICKLDVSYSTWVSLILLLSLSCCWLAEEWKIFEINRSLAFLWASVAFTIYDDDHVIVSWLFLITRNMILVMLWIDLFLVRGSLSR